MSSRETQMIDWMDAVLQIRNLSDAELADLTLAERTKLARSMRLFTEFAPRENWEEHLGIYKRIVSTLPFGAAAEMTLLDDAKPRSACTS